MMAVAQREDSMMISMRIMMIGHHHDIEKFIYQTCWFVYICQMCALLLFLNQQNETYRLLAQ